MGVSQKAADAYRRFKTVKKAYDYYNLAKGALDEDTRSGSLFKGTIKVSMDVAAKVFGSSIKWHPYFTYHKVHFEALSQALNAMDSKELAVQSFNRAVAAADSTSHVTGALQTFTHRRNALYFAWSFTLAEPINMRARHRTSAGAAAAEMKSAGLTPETLNKYVDDSLYEWRANWSELCSDALELYLMVDAEARVAEAAMARYNDKIKKLTEGTSSFGRIAGFAAERDRQWQIFDRMQQPSSGKSDQAVQDPSRYARQQRDAVDAVASRLARACDIILSDAVSTPDTLLRKLDAALMSSP